MTEQPLQEEFEERQQAESDRIERDRGPFYPSDTVDYRLEAGDIEYESNVEPTDKSLLIGGALGGILLAKERIRGRFDRYLDEWKKCDIRESPRAEDRRHSMYELCRVMRDISPEESERMVEELREAGI